MIWGKYYSLVIGMRFIKECLKLSIEIESNIFFCSEIFFECDRVEFLLGRR